MITTFTKRDSQKMEAEGGDILRPDFSNADSTREQDEEATGRSQPIQALEKKPEVCLTKLGNDRRITATELQIQDKDKPWVGLYP